MYITILLPDFLVLDQEAREKNYSFLSMVAVWNDTGIGQIMVECVTSDVIGNYGLADLGALSETFKSLPIKGFVEKPSS